MGLLRRSQREAALMPVRVILAGLTLCIVLLGTTGAASVRAETGGIIETSWVFGDVDCDYDVDSRDALKLLQYHADLRSSLACKQNADVDGNYDVSSVDAALILQYHAGLLDHLPPLRHLVGMVILAHGDEGDCVALQTEEELFVFFYPLKGVSVGQRVEVVGYVEPRGGSICGVGPLLVSISVEKLD
ncbi:MAG: hypothetical protein A2148_02975 [Chloroflexi bacterium RBG_16_68_14]|nr:MAG: hypothetical protein A2148_02975 [Chloroflexi bacterium RBG_16_68_14]